MEIFEINDYYSVIKNNNFTGNEVGQKGSAIYTRQLSLLTIQDNRFKENQPGYSFREDIKRPYELYFLFKRSTLFFFYNTSSKNKANELS